MRFSHNTPQVPVRMPVRHTEYMTGTLAAKQLITANSILDRPLITIENGSILSISTRHASEAKGFTHDFPDATITAGLLDIHMHGAVGHDVMEGTPEALGSISGFLARHGITRYLATTVSASMDFTLRALDSIAGHVEQSPSPGAAQIQGIHIEGPFLSHVKRGMHPPQFLLPPTPETLERLWQASRGHILLMTIAPELPGALETIARANQLGIRCSIGHSNADTPATVNALKAGAVSATHTFNAMRPLDHRDPGILGIVLDREDLYSDLICDGIHVAPELVRLWFKAKGPERAILITDALEATGMPNGTYKLGETPVHVQDGRCTTDAGVLAGSVLTLNAAVTKMRAFTGADFATAIRLASRNPARMLGLPHELTPGASADFNIYTPEGNLLQTMLRGQLCIPQN
jgi:N-acetylglucosamine-6-phosphate deacetylase